MEYVSAKNQKIDKKPHKSIAWIVGNIYLYIISGNILSVIVYEIILKTMPFKESKMISFSLSLLIALITLFMVTKWAVEFILKRSIVPSSEFAKINFIIGIIPVVFSVLILFLTSVNNSSLFVGFLLPEIIGGIIVGAIYGSAVNFWFKRLLDRF